MSFNINPQNLFILGILIFGCSIFMHLGKKNSSFVLLYMLQSVIIAFLLFTSSINEGVINLTFAAVLMLFVKAIVAPTIFFRLIDKHKLTFSASTYMSLPITLI